MKKYDSKGQATVEIALVLPILIFFLLFIIHVGVIVRQHMLVSHASREAARVLSVENNRSKAIEAVSKSLDNAQVEIQRPLGSGQYLTVTVNDVVESPLPILGNIIPSYTASSTTTMRIEK